MAGPALSRCLSALATNPALRLRALNVCSACGVGQRQQHARLLSSRNRPEGKVLEPVGVFEALKQQGKYETGQLFLHSVFGYRGIVLFPWHARLYDRDVASCSSESKTENSGTQGSKEVKGKTHTYYQVLIDTRDCPHIVSVSTTHQQSGTGWLIQDTALRDFCVGRYILKRLTSRGTFRFEKPEGSQLDVRIPPFSLESNKDDKAPPAGYSW
ncbi:polymerase delta-interacting protein 2 [Rhincodon typus]|uniref:polymerase delta-interacting protein 2 n=1 Tax=Rhincodon typus TaxID=259920 RepID=UPI00202F5625|nr:polymerase delta-interacting protein 2 [Rhincodon typus]